ETVVTGFYFKLNYFNNSLLNQFIEESMLYRFFVESTSYDTENVSHYFIYQFSTMDDVHFYILSLLKQVVKMCYFNNKLTKAAFVLLIVEMSQMTDSCLCLHDSDISNNVLAKEILNFIENNIRTVSLENISQKFHFHPNYLSALIKKETGCSYSEWLIKFRIDYAKKYLSQTDLSVQQIIEEVGYSDKTYFFKLFKEHVNMTPGAY
ncbi:helix-turn-helix domain-containing protein, partial [Lactococcus petauri]